MEKNSKGVNIPQVIYLYNENLKGINFSELKSFINNNFAKIPLKIINPEKSLVQTRGILFDPIKTEQSFHKTAFKHEDACCIILTDRLFATYDEDKKLHIRASIYSFPSIISLSGIVEGPAKPKEYYVYKDKFSKLGVWPMEELKIKKKFQSHFIDYEDKRMTEVLKGYISQAVFFYLTGQPFCRDKRCRLFNAHWQEDLIYSQIKIGKFCAFHKRILNSLEKT